LVEQPSGKSENPNLSYAVGVVLAAVYDGLREAYGRAVALETVVSGHWKKVACGRGNVYKPTKKALGRSPLFEDYGVAVWARENGYDGTSWDECDALGIAWIYFRTALAMERRGIVELDVRFGRVRLLDRAGA
jgi:hypothetical protein